MEREGKLTVEKFTEHGRSARRGDGGYGETSARQGRARNKRGFSRGSVHGTV